MKHRGQFECDDLCLEHCLAKSCPVPKAPPELVWLVIAPEAGTFGRITGCRSEALAFDIRGNRPGVKVFGPYVLQDNLT